MEKIPIYMDLFAGLLLALDLFQNWGVLNKVYDKIKGFIIKMDTGNFTNFKTMLFSGSLSIFIFLMLLLWVYYKNSDNVNSGIWNEIGWFSLGIVVAWVFITFVAKIAKKMGVLGIFFLGLLFSILTLVVGFSLHPSVTLAASIVSFVYICFLYPFGMIIAGYAQRILTLDEKKPFYMFAVVGIVLFVASKIFEIAK